MVLKPSLTTLVTADDKQPRALMMRKSISAGELNTMPETLEVDAICSEIQAGIEAELQDTPRYYDFRVAGTAAEGAIWKVYVEISDSTKGGLDESFDGAAAWWAGPPVGAADVLSVIPENAQINLRFATRPPPDPGHLIRIYPPHYLEALLEFWQKDSFSSFALNWLRGLATSNTHDPKGALPVAPFDWLRRAQKEALNLFCWKTSFLWGPPGTGKTTTLGVMLAQHLIQFPEAKILLLSTTNSAVDQALVSADKALEKVASPAAQQIRKRCFRIGNHFVASQYEGREHLLPVKDVALVQQLTRLEAQRPSVEDVIAYDNWKRAVESIRAEIRRQAANVLKSAQLAAMTTTRAIFTFEDMLSQAPFDLIVFDESSQVSLAHAMPMAMLAKSTLFAGDSQQLAPIVRSEHPAAKTWLGRSMFSQMDQCPNSTGLLDEQSRMADAICRIVSNVFYDGKLKVAEDSRKDPAWLQERTLANVYGLGQLAVCLCPIPQDGIWSAAYHGPIRYESARLIAKLVTALTGSLKQQNVLVLTPFRAQRALIRSILKSSGRQGVTVSTVHRAQGSERHTIIFDPVMGSSPFLQTEDAVRLVNVALSRAKARLVLILSQGDRSNPLLNQIANVIECAEAAGTATPIAQFVKRPEFPSCALNRFVQIANISGRVTEILEDGAKFKLCDCTTGQNHTFVTSVVVAKNL